MKRTMKSRYALGTAMHSMTKSFQTEKNSIKKSFFTMHNDIEIYFQNIYRALDTLDSSRLSTPQEYQKASETLLSYYDLPIADSLALELIRRNCKKQQITTSTTLEISNDELPQQYIFYGLQILHELIRRGRWNNPHQVSFGELKTFLLHLALDGFVSSHLTQNKLAAVIVELALIHWPDDWPDLFCVLQSNVTFISTFIILSVFRDLVRISWDFSSSVNLSLEKQRNISKHIEQGANQIMTTLQNASLFLISNDGISSTNIGTTETLSQRSKASLLDLLLDTLGCFSKSPALMTGLIGLHVDEVIFYLLVNFPHKQQEILDVFLTMIESLAKRQRRGTLLIEALEASDVKRLSCSIYKLSQHLTLTTNDHSSFQAKRTIALIVRQFIEKYGGYLLSQGDYDSLENIWKYGILQGIANPSFTISSDAVSAAHALLNQSKKYNVPWMSLPILLSLLFFRSLHQGDPELERLLRILEPRWNASDPQKSCWPLLIIQRDVFQRFGIPQELLIHWEVIYDHTKFWECGIDGIDNELQADVTEREYFDSTNGPQRIDSDILNGTFNKCFSHLKSTIGNSIVSIWTCDTTSKNSLLCFLNFLWDIFINSNVLKSNAVGDPISMLKEAGLNRNFNPTLEKLSDRLVPYLSPSFVFCDGIFSFMEAVAQRTKLGGSEEVFEDLEGFQQASLAFFTHVLTYQFQVSPLFYAFEIRRLDFIGVVSPLMVSTKVPLHQILEFLFEKIFFKVSPENSLDDNLTNECMEGMSDESKQKSYMIRRRALYALMQYCERSANGLMSLLEIALDRIRLRLCCPKIEESERYLLIQTITSMASSSKKYTIQKWLEAQLLQELSPLVANAGLENICRDTNNVISFFYGEAALWQSGDLPSLNALENQQKKASRLISHVEAVFQLSAIPQEISQLCSGDYLFPGVLLDLPMQKIESGCLVVSPELESKMCEENDLSNQFKFALRHPLNDRSNALLDILLHLITTFNDLWKNPQLNNTFPHLNVLLALGEDEWKAIQGETPTPIQGRTLRVLVEDISPIPYSNSTANSVRHTRRHNYHFRMALYRCLGRLGEIHSSFFQYPSIQWKLKVLLLDDIQRLPLPQLITPLDHFGQIFFHENNLVSLQTFSTVPVFGLLKHLLLPLLKAAESRITLGLQELTTLRHRTLDNYDTCSAFLLCAYALRRITLILLDIVSGLVSLKGVCLTEKTKKEDQFLTLQTSQSINKDNENDEEALNIQYASLPVRVAMLKSAIFNDPELLSGLVNFCTFALNFPEVTVIKKAYQTIRLSLISSIFEKCILMVLSANTLCDLTCPTASDTSSHFQCSPLYDFIHRNQSKDGLASMAGSTLYECLFCLIRLHQSAEAFQLKEANQIKAYPELHELCLHLTRLPISLSQQDLNIFMTELLKPPQMHNIKTTKTTLISLYTPFLDQIKKFYQRLHMLHDFNTLNECSRGLAEQKEIQHGGTSLEGETLKENKVTTVCMTEAKECDNRNTVLVSPQSPKLSEERQEEKETKEKASNAFDILELTSFPFGEDTDDLSKNLQPPLKCTDTSSSTGWNSSVIGMGSQDEGSDSSLLNKEVSEKLWENTGLPQEPTSDESHLDGSSDPIQKLGTFNTSDSSDIHGVKTYGPFSYPIEEFSFTLKEPLNCNPTSITLREKQFLLTSLSNKTKRKPQLLTTTKDIDKMTPTKSQLKQPNHLKDKTIHSKSFSVTKKSTQRVDLPGMENKKHFKATKKKQMLCNTVTPKLENSQTNQDRQDVGWRSIHPKVLPPPQAGRPLVVQRTFTHLLAESQRKAQKLREMTLKEKAKKLSEKSILEIPSIPSKLKRRYPVIPQLQNITRDISRLYDVKEIQKKIFRLKELRHQLELNREAEDLAECTFQPRRSRSYRKQQS